jgi:hypothetical protein
MLDSDLEEKRRVELEGNDSLIESRMQIELLDQQIHDYEVDAAEVNRLMQRVSLKTDETKHARQY